MTTRHIALLLGIWLTGVSPALAADGDSTWYAGASVAAQQVLFNPHLTFFDGDDPQQFNNRATGPQLNLIAGQRFRVGRRVSFAYQGAIGAAGQRVEHNEDSPRARGLFFGVTTQL